MALLIIFFALATVIAVPLATGSSLSVEMSGLLGVLALLALLSYTIVTFRSHTAPRRLPKASEIDRELDVNGVNMLFPESGETPLGWAHSMTFIDAISYPHEVFERISERATPYHRSLKMSTTYTATVFRKPISEDQPDFVIPLFLFPKSGLQDGLRAFDRDGKRISTLSTFDVLTYAAAVIRSLVWGAGVKAFKAYIGSLESDVIDAITSRQALDDESIRELRIRLLALDSTSDSDVLSTAAAVVEELSRNHAICVTLPSKAVADRQWPWTFRFGLEYRTIAPIETPGRINWLTRLADGLRLALGVRLNRLYIPIPNAFRTGSYHLEVEGPSGTYLARQGTIPSEEELEIRARYQPRRGQRRAHVYIQRLRSQWEVLFATQFHERSPGSFSSVVSASWAATIVIGLLAAREILGTGSAVLTGASALLPALLAVPIAVASWNRGDSKVFEHPSLLSRTLTFLTILLCLSSFAAAVTPSQILAVPGTVWALLWLLSLGVSATSTYSWVLRLALEYHFFKNADPEE